MLQLNQTKMSNIFSVVWLSCVQMCSRVAFLSEFPYSFAAVLMASVQKKVCILTNNESTVGLTYVLTLHSLAKVRLDVAKTDVPTLKK